MFKIYPEFRYQLTDPRVIWNYIYAGNGVMTLESPSGKSHTYVFQKPRNRNTFPEDVRFVYALHEGSQLFYVGMIEADSFRLTQNSRFLYDTEIVRGARYIWNMAHHTTDGRMKLYHEGVCGRCGRKLTTENSRKVGIGRKCQKLIYETSLPRRG